MTSITTKTAVVKSIGTPLVALEQQLDAALLTSGTVLAAAITGREKARLPLDAGQDAIERLVLAQQQLVAARKAVHEAHYAFREVQDQMRVPPQMFGDHGDTPERFATTGAMTPQLSVVQAA